MICGNCGTENRADRKFCLRCGRPLAGGCPSCGAANEPEAAFCGECGSALRPASAVPGGALSDRAPGGQVASPVPGAPTAERRLVSVLFADLVGFTSIAEGMDAEDTRDLLGRYFETSRAIIERYGGSVEKFIGDAVMAVWGAPTAHEDDAERAVRAALDLVVAVPTLARGGLQARAGVLTGEAAVTLGARGQGMVAGDLVNTASRLQSVAPAGTVLVGEPTFRAASSAIAFEPAGDQALKGKVAPVAAWRAIAVVGKVRGAGRLDRIEAPFVGRDGEFEVLKDQVHATTRERRARLASIVGVAGIGKSRLAWELEKYLDGLVELVYWHRGRSPAYGDGVTFWALGEMVRRRAGVAETDDEATTLEKLDATLAEFVADPDERRWIAPGLRALLGLEVTLRLERDELFATWRRFFERVAARATTVLVFEDLHWADPGLFDFIESLLEWSRNHPILIVTLARPEVFDRRPAWGAGQRNFTAIHLESLPAEAMTRLVTGAVPTLPESVVRRIVARAEGIPLYAVETLRMLIDMGHLEWTPDGFRSLGDVPVLDVPESLQALISARLDGLEPPERAIVQMASVLGLTFTLDALSAVMGEPAATLEPRLRGLIRREILELDVDPRSPERGQYRFVQSMIREVAYATLARRERRSRHLAAARYFEALGDEELAGILATHYLEAFRSSPEGPEADAVAVQARIALEAAAARARGLGSPEQALGFLELAGSVTTDDGERARLWEASGDAALAALHYDAAEGLLRRAIAVYERIGDRRAAARATALLGQVLLFNSRLEPATEALMTALQALPDVDRHRDGVELLGMLARAEMFRNRPREALGYTERGLDAAAALDLPAPIADFLITRAWAVSNLGRSRESIAILQGAIEMAREHGLVPEHIRGANNLGTFWGEYLPRRALEVLAPAVEASERLGHRDWVAKLGFRAWIALLAGDWDLAESIVEAQLRDDLPLLSWASLAATQVALAAWRDGPAAAEPLLREIARRTSDGTNQDRWALAWATVELGLAAGDAARAREGSALMVATGQELGDSAPGWYRAGVTAALTADADRAREALAGLDASPAWADAVLGYRHHVAAIVAALEGRPREATAAFREAREIFARTGTAWAGAWAELDAAALLGADDPAGVAAAEAVRHLAERLRAPALTRRLEERLADRGRGGPSAPRADAD